MAPAPANRRRLIRGPPILTPSPAASDHNWPRGRTFAGLGIEEQPLGGRQYEQRSGPARSAIPEAGTEQGNRGQRRQIHKISTWRRRNRAHLGKLEEWRNRGPGRGALGRRPQATTAKKTCSMPSNSLTSVVAVRGGAHRARRVTFETRESRIRVNWTSTKWSARVPKLATHRRGQYSTYLR